MWICVCVFLRFRSMPQVTNKWQSQGLNPSGTLVHTIQSTILLFQQNCDFAGTRHGHVKSLRRWNPVRQFPFTEMQPNGLWTFSPGGEWQYHLWRDNCAIKRREEMRKFKRHLATGIQNWKFNWKLNCRTYLKIHTHTHTYLPVILSTTTIKNLLQIMTLVSSELFPSIQIIIDSLKLTMLTKRRSANSCRKIAMKLTRTEVLGVKHALPLPFPLIPPLLLH